MTIYYRSRDLVIDTNAFTTRFERFALADLSGIQVARDDQPPTRRLALPAAGGALALAVAAGPVFDSPAGWLVAATALMATLSAGGLQRVLYRPTWQLVALHRGTGVCLLSTTDAQTFGQVKRGLVRALEAGTRV